MSSLDFAVPAPSTSPHWSRLYMARGDEVMEERPTFTGDVYTNVPVTQGGVTKRRQVMITQHPCAIRSDGQELNPNLLVVRVDRFKFLAAEEWQGHYGKMPLPFLDPEHETESRRHGAAFFDRVATVTPAELAEGSRVAILSQEGVNILMQRFTHHNTRVIVPTAKFQDVTGGPFEEADLIQEWAETVGGDIAQAQRDALTWLRTEAFAGGPLRQRMLDNPEQRSSVRKDMRAHLS